MVCQAGEKRQMQTPNTKHQTPKSNTKLQTPKLQGNSKIQTPKYLWAQKPVFRLEPEHANLVLFFKPPI
ncbi:MAG: hypothetical protein C5B50_10300 [Verrucomicrobia bacterium]|nr:MAG: hypothetical protein C5B50_10300 [Verrucomicrobiota bacterium]